MVLALVDLDDALPSCLASWQDLLSYANQLSVRRGGPVVFQVQRWKFPQPWPDAAVALVPARILGGSGLVVPPSDPGFLSELRRRSAQGVLLGAVCAGVFPLAEAGLLTGRRATTHRTLADQFRRQFPRVILDQDALLIEHEGFLLGGGMTAYFDIGLRLVQKMAGPAVARDCAAIFLLDPHRRFQSPFVPAGLGTPEDDPVLARAMDWALAQQNLAFGVAQWAEAVAIEKRTLERRAKAAWGFGPAERLRRLRLDRARILLSGPALRWDEVAERCGYRDPAAFRRLFLQRFGQAPGEYRRRFG